MSHYTYILYFLFAAMWLCACDNSEDSIEPSAPGMLVVEGWIEDEAKPIVIVTRAADLSQTSGPIDEMVQRWCKITVSDGSVTEQLAMHVNKDYIPPFIYTSAKLRGKVGHTYTLTVETDTDTVSAVTTIPPVAHIDSLVYGPKIDDPSMYSVKLFGNVNPDQAKYYKIFTRVNSEPRYYSSFLGTFRADEYERVKGWNAARGIHQTFDGHFTPNYVIGDTVSVKLCTMDAQAYEFWQSYETAVSLQSNFFFSSTNECKGNINGGKGYWAGYGTSFARCVIADPRAQ